MSLDVGKVQFIVHLLSNKGRLSLSYGEIAARAGVNEIEVRAVEESYRGGEHVQSSWSGRRERGERI